MAKRPIFMPDPHDSLVVEERIEFQWFPGFAVVQKQRSIEALHLAAGPVVGDRSILEISTKSQDPLGVQLSAFNLTVSSTELEYPLVLEAAFQGSKVFATSGQHVDLYSFKSGREVKKYMKELPEDELVGFQFEEHEWELTPKTAFYDWLYLKGLCDLEVKGIELERQLFRYGGFTDIEFNPEKSINCQARACALFVALSKAGLKENAMSSPEEFVATLKGRGYGVPEVQNSLF